MSERDDKPGTAAPVSTVQVPQNLAGGLILVAIAALALWLLRDLDAGSLSAMGSALMPRVLAVGLGILGAAVAASSFFHRGLVLERLPLRGPALIILAIATFAATIRPLSIGPIMLPGFGLIVAAPLSIVISGFATREARLRELLVLALALTPACMLLFGDLLNLTIPMLPTAMMDAFPDGWSQKAMLRTAAAAMLAVAALLYLTGAASSKSNDAKAKN
ncbi:tripartite tricarboxylate transporter TctB family protein [Agrobacterium sp. a22-2]|uniref:tripartite tricarboxylate transporter TctB family protein n=1 Tax=Agrobacterium sp. a22-2 TaxID=2283840 RepID=UPI001446AE45|nr:tripartite tricarboxylate transporter TctB family protein [Agrobacterium sp. a22-2]NKN37334.1 tripartite tricarboxylate transporter TctB family protein [Agrobacterium sp. a22-2]